MWNQLPGLQPRDTVSQVYTYPLFSISITTQSLWFLASYLILLLLSVMLLKHVNFFYIILKYFILIFIKFSIINSKETFPNF